MEPVKSDPHRSAGVPPAVAGASRPRAPLWATLVGTFFGAGRLSPGPGTWGSVATVILWGLALADPGRDLRLRIVLAAFVVTLIGIPAATRVARSSGLKDPQFVVIDEVAGQLVALIAVPLGLENLSRGLYTFSWLRYREAVSDSAVGTAARGHRHCGGRLGAGFLRSPSCIFYCTLDF